jgi:F-type H+-transporting ATPase subunit c
MMDAEAASLLGAGIACLGMGLAAIGVGNIFGNFLSGALRNPSAATSQFTNALIGAALAEGLGIFALVIAFLLVL